MFFLNEEGGILAMCMYAWMVFVETAPERYDIGMKIMTLGRLDKIKDMIAEVVKPNDKILDIGCGTGTLALRCIKKGAHVAGLDSSEFMLEQAAKKASQQGLSDRLQLIKESVTQLQKHFQEESLDIIVATAALGEFPKAYLDYIFRECARILRKEGRLIIADEVQPEGRISRFFYNIVMGIVWIPQFIIVRRVCYPIKNLDKIIESAGFDIEEKRKMSLSKLQVIFARKKV